MSSSFKHVSAVILAAGAGQRMNSEFTKQLMPLGDETVLSMSVGAFEACESVKSIVVVARREELPTVKKMLSGRFKKLYAVVVGGECRQESARLGFLAIPPDSEYVAVHDAARCLVTADMIKSVSDSAVKFGAATAASPIFDTVKRVDKNGFVVETLKREELFAVGTPQVFERGIYERALALSDGALAEFTDDNMMVEKTGVPIACVNVGRENIKLTTSEDIALVKTILEKRKCSNTE